MYQIIVTIVSIATGQPVADMNPGYVFETRQECRSYIRKNAAKTIKIVKAESGGAYTIHGVCVNAIHRDRGA